MLDALQGVKHSIHVSASQRCESDTYLTDGAYLFPAACMVSAPARIAKLRTWRERGDRPDKWSSGYDRRSVTADSCAAVWRSAIDNATAPAVAAPELIPKGATPTGRSTAFDLVEFAVQDRPAVFVDARKLAFAYSHTKFDAVQASPESELAPLALYRDGAAVGVLMPVRPL